MRILLLTQWFDPEPTIKGLLFAKELERRGHEVRVITGYPNYPGGTLYPGYRIRWRTREVVEGIPVTRVPLYPSHDGSALRRIANYVTFAVSASVACLAGQRPDVAYVYHPPATIGLPAFLLKTFRRVPFVYDVQDLWPDTLAATGMLRAPRLLQIIGFLLRVVYGAAATITVLSPGFRRALIERGVEPDKIKVVPNWASEERLGAQPSGSRDLRVGPDEKFTVLFAGTMGRAQALDTVLSAAELLVKDDGVRFVLVGGGTEATHLAAEVSRRELGNVELLPWRPAEQLGELIEGADALLVHLKDDPLFTITIPSKTQAYLRSGRPILMGVAGDAADMLREAAAGLCFPPEDAGALVDAVMSMRAMDPADRERMGTNGARFYAERLSLRVGVDAFVQIFESAHLARSRNERRHGVA